MNTKDNEKFLTMIEQQFSRNNSLYLTGNDVKQDGFYFYGQDNTEIFIAGLGDNINFNIKNRIKVVKNAANHAVFLLKNCARVKIKS